jgi:Na+/melibiose symporter-like transporter
MICCGIVVWVILGTTERNPEESYKITSFCAELRLLKGIYKNRYLRTLCYILLLKRIGIGAMEAVGAIYLVRNEFHRETLSNLLVGAFPLLITIPLLVGKFITGRMINNKVAMIAVSY